MVLSIGRNVNKKNQAWTEAHALTEMDCKQKRHTAIHQHTTVELLLGTITEHNIINIIELMKSSKLKICNKTFESVKHI